MYIIEGALDKLSVTQRYMYIITTTIIAKK